MTETSIPQKDWPYYKSEYDAGRMSQGAIAKQFNITQSAVSKHFKRMDREATVNGSPESEPDGEPDEAPLPIEPVHSGLPDGSPDTALQRIEYLGEPGSPDGLPKIAMQSEVDELKTRVSVLEAFFATIQRQPAFLPGSPTQFTSGSPSGSPTTTHKRGFVLADDLWDAIHSYASAHHRQISEVVDQGLREFFAHHGWPGQEVDADA